MDNENNELNRINEELKKAEDLVLPESLSKESIKELLKEQTPLKAVSKKAFYRRLIAFAAVLAIVFTVLIQLKPWKDDNIVINQGGNKNYSGKVEVPNSLESYKQIEKIFVEYHKSTQRRLKFPSYFNFSQATAEKSELVDDDIVGSSQAGQSSYGKTNEQVAGVNEADIVKNDGNYIYMAVNRYDFVAYDSGNEVKGEISGGSSDDIKVAPDIIQGDGASKSTVMPGYGPSKNAVAIIKPSKNGEMKVESIISAQKDDSVLNQNIINMYVKGDLLHAVYDCYNSKDYQTSTLVVTFDISDRQNPFEVRRFYQSGSHISTRLINDFLVLITNYNVAIYEDADRVKDNCIPETGTDYATRTRIPAENICIMDNTSSPSYLVISNINLSLPDKDPVTASILGAGQNIYCTVNKLYITNGEWNRDFTTAISSVLDTIEIAPADGTVDTTIYSFDISKGNVIFKADKTVEGSVLNQFSIDEYNGYLRIATTTGNFANANNFVYILSASSLEQVGVLKNIAPGESIKSVRFAQERGYVVTFLQTDPLFVIDLSKAANPKILGELKITGFSSYLHPITPTLLAGIGVDGTNEGQTDDLKVSLFDVSNPSDPREVDKAVFGNNTQYVYSAAYYDHKAICYDEESKILCFPIEITEYLSYNNNYGYSSTSFQGVIGLRIDSENKKLGEAAKYLINRNGQSSITRATYIGDLIFACSDSCIYSFNKTSQKLLFNIDFSNYDFPKEYTPRPNKPAFATQEDSSQISTTAESSSELETLYDTTEHSAVTSEPDEGTAVTISETAAYTTGGESSEQSQTPAA